MKKALWVIVILLLAMPSVQAVHGQSTQQSSIAVTYVAQLSQKYSVLAGITTRFDVVVAVARPPHTDWSNISIGFTFAYLSVRGLPPGASLRVSVTNQHPVVTKVEVKYPPSYDNFNFTLRGQTQDFSLLYRDTGTLPHAYVSASFPPYLPVSYNLLIPNQPGLDVVSVFPQGATVASSVGNRSVISENVVVGGVSNLVIDDPNIYSQIVVLYQPSYRDYLVVAYAILAAAGVFLLPRLYRWMRPKALGIARRPLVYGQRAMAWFTAKRLLGLFALSAGAMLGISMVFGPAPVPRLYLAATPNTAATLGPALSNAGYQYFTPLNAGDEFGTMSSAGIFNAVIVSDYPPSPDATGLLAANKVYVIASDVPASYVRNLTALYGLGKVTVFPTDASLISAISGSRLYVVNNRFGLPVGQHVYGAALAAVGLLTIVITFFAMAYLSRQLVENGSSGWSFLAEAAVLPILVFVFTAIVFLQSSVLLGLPVALHAAVSSSESAIGALGFGGGSRPRELAGVAGFIFGAVVGFRGRMNIDRIGVLAAIGVSLYLVVDPLSLGKDFYSVLLNLTTSESGGPTGLGAQEAVRGWLGQIMNFFGKDISGYFYSSHGAVLFFAAGTAFAVFSRLRKTSATILLLFSSFATSVGFIRVADLDPIEAIASPIPGIAVGLLILVGFLAMSFGESKIRDLIS